MEDYPKTIAEFEKRFATENACQDYLFVLRWPDGFVCPRCLGQKSWLTDRGLLVCSVCGYHASLRAGTIFQGSRKPLQMWFRAIWWITSQKTRQAMIQKIAIRFVNRPAIRNFDSSTLQPDFIIL
jgi:predicted amidophosphoribosyltransferase